MEELVLKNQSFNPSEQFWRNRRVLVTGHTGFKGGWLTLWLNQMGAEVTGLALSPDTNPSYFEVVGVNNLCDSKFVDIRDRALLLQAVAKANPQIVFHLAAQPLVRKSYVDPIETWSSNVMGTIHVLEALRIRQASELEAVVVVTSDKCYEPVRNENAKPFKEGDVLGGHDPYSSSKAATEIAVASWRRSFFAERGVGIASARAGNVIGGGDWAADRLVPDILRGQKSGTPVSIRYPDAVRPWQHVLEPLCGYLLLAERLAAKPAAYAEAWNFGPDIDAMMTVAKIADRLTAKLGENANWQREVGQFPHESAMLLLDSTKARTRLGWKPRWSVDQAVDAIAEWHQAFDIGNDMREVSIHQLKSYTGMPVTAGAVN